jgi:hypothetical protein
MIFTTPQRWIAIENASYMEVLQVSANGQPIFTTEINQLDSPDFTGLLLAQPFDSVFFTQAPYQVHYDDLHFGASITGDVNFDARVDVVDLAEVILAWGLCVGPPPAICLADLDYNGTVNVDDVYVVIGAWSGE